MRRVRLFLALLILILLGTGAPGGRAAPSTVPAGRLLITGAALSADLETGRVFVEGNVRISGGGGVATGSRLVLDTRRRIATLEHATVQTARGTIAAAQVEASYRGANLTGMTARGGALLSLPQAAVAADAITLLPGADEVQAAGRVQVASGPLRATGSRLVYRQRAGRFMLAGPVRLRHPQAVITARELEGTEDLREATLRGDVRIQAGDIGGRADLATLNVRDQKVVLVGNVVVRQGSRELRAARVTIFYAARRVIAEGPTELRFEEPKEPGPFR